MKKKCLFLTAFIPFCATSLFVYQSQVYITIDKHTQCFAFQSYITGQLVSSDLSVGHQAILQEHKNVYRNPMYLISLEISPFYSNNALKMYIKSIRALSNYKRPKDI